MLQTTNAIVLHHSRVGDNGHLLRIYTQLYGPMTVMVRGGKRAALRQVLMQPLSLVNLVISQKPKQTIPSVSEGSAETLLQTIPYDPIKSSIAIYMSELLEHVLKAQSADAPLYDFIRSSIIYLDEVKQHYANFHLVFTIKLTYFLGIFPNLSQFDEGVYFDMENSIFTPIIPVHTHYLNPDDSMSFAHLMRLNYDTMSLFALSRTQRQRILQEMIHYYQLHIPGLKAMQSLSILEQLFD